MNDAIKAKIHSLIEPVIRNLGYQLIDIKFRKEEAYKKTTALDVVIGKSGGVTIDDCVKVSRAISPILDEHDPISNAYILEVSSAGIDTTN